MLNEDKAGIIDDAIVSLIDDNKTIYKVVINAGNVDKDLKHMNNILESEFNSKKKDVKLVYR
jgi:glycine cleavage system aminomethyltransferase T